MVSGLNYKKLGIIFLLIAVFTFNLFSQARANLSRAIVKTPFPIKSVCWNENDTLFAYSENNIVYVRDAYDYEIVDTIPINDVRSISFAKEGTVDVILTLYERGLFSIWDLTKEIPTLTESYNNNYSKLYTCAFSNDSNYIATAGDDNSVNIYFKLRVTRQTIRKKLNGHKAPVYSLAFSNDSEFLASASLDGKVVIWNCAQNSAVSVINGIYSDSEVPVAFSYDDNSIFCCDSPTSFGVYDLNGQKIKSVRTGIAIKKIQSLHGANVVAVLTEDNKIKLFDLRKNTYFGYIPAYNVSTLTDFMFNSDNNYVLVGYDDGSVYKLNIEESLLAPGEEPPQNKIIQNYEIVVKGATHNSGIFSNGKEFILRYIDKDSEVVERKREQEIVPEPKSKKETEITIKQEIRKEEKEKKEDKEQKPEQKKDYRNSIAIYGGLNILSSPFMLGPALGAEFKLRKPLAPFYLGGGLEGTLGFVNSGTFTMKYEINGVSQNSPFLFGGNLYVPFGLIFPMGKGSIELSVNMRAGVRVMSIMLLSNGNYMVGEPYFTFMAYAGLGFHFWNFQINAGCKYDFIGQFTPAVELGYNIRVGK